MKSAQQATQKWVQNTQGATQTWITNLQGTTKPIVAAAVAQKSVMTTNFNDAVNSGRWEAALQAVGDGGIKAAAAAKQANYGTGVSAASDKFGSFMTKLINYEQAGLSQIYSMPKGNTSAGIARATAWIQYMAAGKGSFK
jgi:hypothetical protein